MVTLARIIPTRLDLRAQRESTRAIGAAPQVDVSADAGLRHQLGLIRERVTGYEDVTFRTHTGSQIRGKEAGSVENAQHIERVAIGVEMACAAPVIDTRAVEIQLHVDEGAHFAAECDAVQPVVVTQIALVIG